MSWSNTDGLVCRQTEVSSPLTGTHRAGPLCIGMHLKPLVHCWPSEQSATQRLPLFSPMSTQPTPGPPQLHDASESHEEQMGDGTTPSWDEQLPTGTNTYLSNPTTLPLTVGGALPGGGEPDDGGGIGVMYSVTLVASNSTMDADS